ncbi:TerD family protein [Rhodococcus tibetensis]|uniref:TerD family protein n=1 Tax=Rhodococcus tibetensis TaxID=2965064 RepID=UPI0027E2181E|nr:TerD family protein [Rhodococcus sp. FXJ9.536]
MTGARQGTVDLFVFQLGADLKVRTDADLVFFNNASTPEGAVTLTGGQVTLHLAAVPAAVDTLAVAVALDENAPGSLAQVPGLAVTLTRRAVLRSRSRRKAWPPSVPRCCSRCIGATGPGRCVTGRPGGVGDSMLWSPSTA